jgi:Cdc6-like AAA superfamily ATPase
MGHVAAAHEEMFCSPKILGIRSCSKYEQFFLRAIVYCFQKSGLEETSFDRVFDIVCDLAAGEGTPKMNSAQVYDLCFGLSGCKLILAEAGRCGPQLRIRLNVSQDDVIFALDSKTA